MSPGFAIRSLDRDEPTLFYLNNSAAERKAEDIGAIKLFPLSNAFNQHICLCPITVRGTIYTSIRAVYEVIS